MSEEEDTGMDTAIKVVNLINAAAPGVASLIVLLRRKDGKISVMTFLDEAEDGFDENINRAKDFLQREK
ncbi:MAG: hypothetical protein U1D99_05050 [Candidatus Omnitrophota bacterium]|nr:hypothetical protein [Candidatus Omnitrophota bacterium]